MDDLDILGLLTTCHLYLTHADSMFDAFDKGDDPEEYFYEFITKFGYYYDIYKNGVNKL